MKGKIRETWEEYQARLEGKGWDPRTWKKGMRVLIGRTREIEVMDEGTYIDHGYRALWWFEVRNVEDGYQQLLAPGIYDKILEEANHEIQNG